MSEAKQNQNNGDVISKFTLIELLTIIILVGLIFIFFVPVNQAKINRARIADAVTTVKFIGDKAEEFKNNPDNGYYPDMSQLNLGSQVDTTFFNYQIITDDSTIVAETKSTYGKKGAFLVYSLNGKQFRIGKNDADLTSAKYINENWLP
jgi:Tfp pilus assembly protein PilE